MNELRKKSLKSNIIVIVLFIAVGIFLIGCVADSFITYLSKPQDLDELDFSQDLDGTYGLRNL